MRKQQTKTEFVLSIPASTRAAEVVELAKKRGIKLTARHVYVIRSIAKKKAGAGGRRGARGRGTAEAELRSAIAELGLARAREVLAQVERAFRS